ncbi:MAG: hypothetical protein ACE5JB_05555 [bacterium]
MGAIVALAKLLSIYEDRYGLSSEDFYDKFSKSEKEDSKEFIEWGT